MTVNMDLGVQRGWLRWEGQVRRSRLALPEQGLEARVLALLVGSMALVLVSSRSDPTL